MLVIGTPSEKHNAFIWCLQFLFNRQEEERRRREEEMIRKREMEEQMRRQREDNYRMGNFMDVSSTYKLNF